MNVFNLAEVSEEKQDGIREGRYIVCPVCGGRDTRMKLAGSQSAPDITCDHCMGERVVKTQAERDRERKEAERETERKRIR